MPSKRWGLITGGSGGTSFLVDHQARGDDQTPRLALNTAHPSHPNHQLRRALDPNHILDADHEKVGFWLVEQLNRLEELEGTTPMPSMLLTDAEREKITKP